MLMKPVLKTKSGMPLVPCADYMCQFHKGLIKCITLDIVTIVISLPNKVPTKLNVTFEICSCVCLHYHIFFFGSFSFKKEVLILLIYMQKKIQDYPIGAVSQVFHEVL
jgi:hypothetical protein